MPDSCFRIGDYIRVLSVPPGVEEFMPEESRRIFRLCVGKVLRIEDFDEYGQLELHVNKDGSQALPENEDVHWIWIESEFVEFVSAS